MRKALIVLGWAFLGLIVLGVGVFAVGYWIAAAAEHEGKAYVDRVAPRGKIDTLFDAFSRRLGALQRYGGASRQHYFVNFTLQGPVVTMIYTADAVFEKGPATLRIQTVRRAGQWKLLEVYVQSDSLLR
jgi:hypothetical protein